MSEGPAVTNSVLVCCRIVFLSVLLLVVFWCVCTVVKGFYRAACWEENADEHEEGTQAVGTVPSEKGTQTAVVPSVLCMLARGKQEVGGQTRAPLQSVQVQDGPRFFVFRLHLYAT